MGSSPIEKLRQHAIVWNKKAALRRIYERFFDEIQTAYVEGSTLEVGAGFGSLKQYCESIISTDIVRMPNLDVVCDAQALPFSDHSFDNVVAIDTIHHVERPIRFLTSSSRLLRPGGRLILLEPAITPFGRVVYRFHDEPVDMERDPTEDGPLDRGRDPFDANQAVGTLLCGKYRSSLEKRVPGIEMLEVRWISFLAYPLSGGFQRWSLLPSFFVDPLFQAEKWILRIFGPLLATRMLLVFERIRQS